MNAHPSPAPPTTATARSFTAEARIARSPGEVWAALTDLAAMPRWVEGLVEARILGAGPLRVGARMVEVRKVQGRVHEVTLDIEAWEPGRRLVRGGTTPVGRVTYTYTLEAVAGAAGGAATLLRLRGEVRPRGVAQRILLPLAWPALARDRRLPERLNAVVEADEKERARAATRPAVGAPFPGPRGTEPDRA